MMAHDTEELEHDAARGALEPQRDLPLTFRWRTDLRAIAALGLAPARTSRHDDARNAVLTEALARYKRASRYVRRMQSEWIARAEKALREHADV